MKNVLCLLGAPGVGKGTFSTKFLRENPGLSIKHFSVGHELRKILTDPTGNLAKLELVEELVDNFLTTGEKFILDGYPRSLEQLKNLVTKPNKLLFVNLQLSDQEKLYARLCHRYTCGLCGWTTSQIGRCDICNTRLEMRLDDTNLAAITRRMDIYHQEIISIEDFCITHKLQFCNFEVSGHDWMYEVNNLLLNFFRD